LRLQNELVSNERVGRKFVIKQITYTALPNIPLVEPGDDLPTIILTSLNSTTMGLEDGDALVIAQKVFSKIENRFLDLDDVIPSKRALELAKTVGKDPSYIEAILSEATEILRTREELVIVEHRLGYIMANAGIDESNIDHQSGRRVLLLPQNPDESCRDLRDQLFALTGANVGIVMNDSFGRPWRNGVVGVALGSAGIPSLVNLIGTPDLFGRKMRVTEVAVADELAAAGSLVMGQAAEGLPIIHVRGLSWSHEATSAMALIRPKERDMFR
jgi:coenzyme F420-0:L-glutamate ligase / coenzyme F420-1:gamma-L-glutamate ligase